MRKLYIAAFTATAATLLACGSGGNTAGPGAQDQGSAEPKKGEKTVVMEVTGAKSADITYGLGTDQSQDNGAKVPWKKELKTTDALLLASIVAQNKGGGTIACKITVDGKVVKENKSTGEYAVVTCNGN